jgi:excinuclease ABC subunit A
MEMPDNSRIMLLAPLEAQGGAAQEKLLRRLRKEGFARVRIGGEILACDEVPPFTKKGVGSIDAVVDRLIIKPGIEKRLSDSLELALSLGSGILTVLSIPDMTETRFSEQSVCTACGIGFPELTPSGFSFNSPQGACPACDGLGATVEFDPDLIVPDRQLSLREGAVVPWTGRDSVQFAEFLDALTAFYGQDIYTPFDQLSEEFRQVLMNGSGTQEIPFHVEQNGKRHLYRKTYEGVLPNLQRLLSAPDSHLSKEDIRAFMSYKTCSQCRGTRLNEISGAVRVSDMTLSDITALSIENAHEFFSSLAFSGQKQVIAQGIIKEVRERLSFLRNVGLDYLTLDRGASTLSGGESQRIRLATQIGSKLTGVLYVLDEPSIGLHQRDNRRLLSTLLRLRDIGNTVLVVEHDEETMMSADHIIDMGPAAGIHGGQVVFSGPPAEILGAAGSLTADYLSGRRRIHVPTHRRKGNGRSLVIRGASGNNLKGIDAVFPLGCFICVTGVSGSGKSTLVLNTLHRILANRLFSSRLSAGPFASVQGIEHLDRVIHIDQSPIGKTPRSNPATYTGIFAFIREVFSKTPDARARGYKSGRFSFNVKGGRCEACQGDGIIRIEMHFLPDVYVSCDVCRGRRYNRETLDIRYKGKTIAEVLDMTVNQCLSFFERIQSIRVKLQTLADVGLGYIRIGQSATTLSGGEAQRIKLARELSKKSTGRTIYILDEPTSGLHTDDINRLLTVLNRFVDSGDTVVVIEHNLDVIKVADHVIDLGPEGGEKGGTIVGTGTPEELASVQGSHTGFYLKKVLAPRP